MERFLVTCAPLSYYFRTNDIVLMTSTSIFSCWFQVFSICLIEVINMKEI